MIGRLYVLDGKLDHQSLYLCVRLAPRSRITVSATDFLCVYLRHYKNNS